MRCQVLWNVKCHEMSNAMKCQMPWNVKCHEMSIHIHCSFLSSLSISKMIYLNHGATFILDDLVWMWLCWPSAVCQTFLCFHAAADVQPQYRSHQCNIGSFSLYLTSVIFFRKGESGTLSLEGWQTDYPWLVLDWALDLAKWASFEHPWKLVLGRSDSY